MRCSIITGGRGDAMLFGHNVVSFEKPPRFFTSNSIYRPTPSARILFFCPPFLEGQEATFMNSFAGGDAKPMNLTATSHVQGIPEVATNFSPEVNLNFCFCFLTTAVIVRKLTAFPMCKKLLCKGRQPLQISLSENEVVHGLIKVSDISV
jgi:hypothetical protein